MLCVFLPSDSFASLGKRSASEDSDDSNPKKKSRLLDVPSPSLTESCPVGEVMNLSRKGEAKPQAEATVEQVDGALAQVNKEIQVRCHCACGPCQIYILSHSSHCFGDDGICD